jgi:hypothetical protein
MTLILTELSEAGIAMAADSAITYRDKQGRLTQKAPQNWLKLLKVPSVKAAVSYWGTIGVVNKRFDHWLQNLIRTRTYQDVSTLADCIASELNQACGDRPLSGNNCVGVHVAGYAPWSDGVCRPVFFHVHNGHGNFIINKTVEEQNKQSYITKLTPKIQAEPRKLFEKYQDFPGVKCSLDNNLENLRKCYITRNGDYLMFSIIAEQLSHTFACLNLITGLNIPRNPSNLQSRLGYLLTMIDITISIYSCSTALKTIGRPVVGLGIRPDGSYVDGSYSRAINLLKNQ